MSFFKGGRHVTNRQANETTRAASAVVATADDDHSIRLWEVNTGKERGRLIGHTGAVRSLVFARDGVRLYSGSEDSTALVWDVTEAMKPAR